MIVSNTYLTVTKQNLISYIFSQIQSKKSLISRKKKVQMFVHINVGPLNYYYSYNRGPKLIKMIRILFLQLGTFMSMFWLFM